MQVQILLSKFLVQFWQCDGLYLVISSSPLAPRSVTALQLSTTYLIDEVDEPLGFFTPKTSCDGNLVRGMYQGPNIRDGLGHRHVRCTGAIVEDGC